MNNSTHVLNVSSKVVAVLTVAAFLFSLGGVQAVLAEMTSDITVDPAENIWVLNEGDVEQETVTVTFPEGVGVDKADIYFLADTTGSMASPIASVKADASDIMNDLIADLPGVDLAFGAGDFKDFQSPNQTDPYAFNHGADITDDIAMVQAAIDNWAATGGADLPEGQFYAYDQIAEDRAPSNDGSPAGTIGWRADSKKILLAFGDAPAHDPVCSAITSQVNGHELPYDITETTVIDKFVDEDITFVGISTVTGLPDGMDSSTSMFNYNSACGTTGPTDAGQATRIADATGGVHIVGVDSDTIVQVIADELDAVLSTINNVSLVATGDITPFVTNITPEAGYGPLDNDEEHELSFDVEWTGVVACGDEDQVFTGTLDVVADSAVVAYKPVTITVPACPDEALEGRMTGGGSVFADRGQRVTHGLRLECDSDNGPNNLQVNWGRGERFHLEEMTYALCTLDPDIDSGPRPADFNTHEGAGEGRYKNQDGATIEWRFTDAGEPGSSDTSWMRIVDADGSVVLEVEGELRNGNLQAHRSE